MAKVEKPAGLERDFGYLFPFFEKIAAAAREMPAGPERARVEQLVAEERRRWEEIRALVGGKRLPAASTAVPTTQTRSPVVQRTSAQAVEERTQSRRTELPRRGLTVGSLRPPE